MPIYYESNLDGSLELAEQYLDFNPKSLILEFLATNNWNIISNSPGRSSLLTANIEKEGVEMALLIHVSRIHNQEEGRDRKEKRIQVGVNSSTGLYNYPFNQSPHGLVLGIYKRDIFKDTIICAWPTHAIPSSGSTDSLRIKIDVISKALTNGIHAWFNTDQKIICAFRPEHIHTYILNRERIHNNTVDVLELIGQENQTESIVEEATQTGDFDIDDISSNPSLSTMTKERFKKQYEDMEGVGLNGEKKLNLYFLSLQAKGKISDYEWTAKIFPFYPYDFKFTRDGVERYVDAKTTTGAFNRKLFISLNELKMMNSCDNYDLYRLYNDGNENTKLKIAENVNSLGSGILRSLTDLPDKIKATNFSIVPDFFNFNELEIELE